MKGRFGPLLPKDFVAINGIVIFIYVGWRRYTHCLATFDGLVGPDTKPIAVAFPLHLHLQLGIVAISVSSTPVPGFVG
jgi:hypothetical protein